MKLFRVILDEGRAQTKRLLSSPEYLHAAVEGSFADPGGRHLWRTDWLDGRCCLLVLSAQEADFARLVQEYGFPAVTPAWESRDYQPLLQRLQKGQAWRFRLKANPVRSVKQEGAARGKVMAHVTSAQQKNWLLQRAPALGFTLPEEAFDVVHTQWFRFHKPDGRVVTLRTATFEGTLLIEDPQALQEALLSGIGRAKAYGCGLMTLAAASPSHG